jgi:hypothetical protein
MFKQSTIRKIEIIDQLIQIWNPLALGAAGILVEDTFVDRTGFVGYIIGDPVFGAMVLESPVPIWKSTYRVSVVSYTVEFTISYQELAKIQ